ncbi:MAG: hypothetical protein ABRQ39_01500 [Candidatus Eremiobacterota bacterium]
MEIAAQDGVGEFHGKKVFLSNIYKVLNGLKTDEASRYSRAFILASSDLGGQKLKNNNEIVKLSENIKMDFLNNPLRSKPIGFYTWNNELKQIFQQDRLLQTVLVTPLPHNTSVTLSKAIIDAGEENFYVTYLTLCEKLTNPFIGEVKDLRLIIDKLSHGEKNGIKGAFVFFPPSRSYETELIKELYGYEVIPEGFNLADKLIEEVRSGHLDITPEENSGWYDYQTYSLEPLILPDKFPEAKKVEFSEPYKKQILTLFKSTLSLMRETHVKQGEFPWVALGLICPGIPTPTPKPVIYISPELSMEPLVTYYLRRAQSYSFIHKVLLDAFGKESLKQIHRFTVDGPVEKDLDQELSYIEALFYGSAELVACEIGCKPDLSSHYTPSIEKTEAIKTAREWTCNLDKDSDVYRDNRMMVPVFYDLQRQKTKVWVFLGYETKPLYVNFKSNPAVKVFGKDGKELRAPLDVYIFYRNSEKDLIYPVFAEIYVNKILDREEFRNLCDKYKTRSEILEALQN